MRTRVFVGGVAWKTTEDDLLKAFAQFGNVKEAKIITDKETGRSRGFAFVNYEDEEGASNAVNEGHGMVLDDRELRVDWATEKQRGGGNNGNGQRKGGGRRRSK